jgi:hypothetical protein
MRPPDNRFDENEYSKPVLESWFKVGAICIWQVSKVLQNCE